MRNSPWSLLVLATSIATLAWAALFLPTMVGGSGQRESVWNLLTEWQRTGIDSGPLVAEVVGTSLGRNGLLQGRHIQLRVEDQDGKPLQGAAIRCDRITRNSIGRVAEGLSNAIGQYASPRLMPGDYEVHVSMIGFLPTPVRTWKLPQDGGEMHAIRLQAGCLVQGRINGTDGAPRNHGILLLTEDGEGQVLQVEPDIQGIFHFPAVAEGRWILSWRTHRRAPTGPLLQRTLSCRAGQTLDLLVTLTAFDPRVPTDPNTLGVGIHDLVRD